MRAWRGRRVAVTGTLVMVLAAASGCGGERSEPITAIQDGQVRLYGSDGNMSNSFGDELKDQPGLLAGMKGTAPLTPLSEEFKKRVQGVDSTVADFNYAGESYDAVTVAALAAEVARATEGAALAKYIVGVTVDGTTCSSYKDCVNLIRNGQNPAYRGVSSLKRTGFTDAGEPSTATYGTLNFGRNNHIDEGKTEFVGAGDDKTEAKSGPAAPNNSTNRPPNRANPLKIGGLLPKTGALAQAGPPLFAGARLAVKEINDAGGVLDDPVEWQEGDDGTSPQVAVATAEKFINSGVQVIIGAAASGVTTAVLPKTVAAGRVLISPSATSDSLSQIDDKGLFFRTSPPDKLQARALADIVMRDGAKRVMIVARDDAYGNGLRDGVRSDLTAAGLKAQDVQTQTYPAKDQYDPVADLTGIFDPLAKGVKKQAPDAVLVIGYAESALLIKALRTSGVTFRS